jgi:hypothetical protein
MLRLLTVMILMTSMIANGKEPYGNHTVTVAVVQTVTQNAQAHVHRIKRIPKFSVLRSNPYRLSKLMDNPDEDIFVDDDGLISARRRRDLTKVEHPDEISPRVRWRLFLARQLALLKYREIWADKA